MAFIISSKTNTDTTITFNLQFTEAAGGTYYMIFYCGDEYHKSSNFTLSAGGSRTLTWEFDDLEPSTDYYIYGELYNSNDDPLLTTSNSQWYYTDDPPLVAVVYYARIRLYGNGGTWDGSPYKDYDSWGSGWTNASIDIDIDFNGSGFIRSGYILVGFAKSSSATSATYDIEDTYTVESDSDDEDNPTMITLYAVWKTVNERPEDWVWKNTIKFGYPIKITADEWLNYFIPKIKEFAVYCNVTLNSTYLSEATTGVASGKNMTATQMNGARKLVNQLDISESVPSKVESGTTAKAQFLIDLTNALNSII